MTVAEVVAPYSGWLAGGLAAAVVGGVVIGVLVCFVSMWRASS